MRISDWSSDVCSSDLSVLSTMARRTVQVRAYATRIVVRCGEEVVAEHARTFGRNRTIYDPWHYLPVLARQPGALRNGAPFQDWDLPPALARLRRKPGPGDDDRRDRERGVEGKRLRRLGDPGARRSLQKKQTKKNSKIPHHPE